MRVGFNIPQVLFYLFFTLWYCLFSPLYGLSDKVNYILDEIIMAGMVLETNINSILASINEQNKLHLQSEKGTVSTIGK